MSEHLLALSIGPVQEFIAAARRTRDLWFGSYMLSELSKAAAKFIKDSGGTLIFPAPDGDSLLEPDSELLVTNHILAKVPENLDPAVVARDAKKAAHARWLEFANSALKLAGESSIRRDIWDEQINDVLEFYAAWVPLDQSNKAEGADGYQEARRRLDLILAGRKALRDFQQVRGRSRVPKSSLDGARESVLSINVGNSPELRRRIGVKRQEQLDAVGLVKRCAAIPAGKQHTEFVSVVRVAADPWIRGKAKASRTDGRKTCLKEIWELCRSDFAPKISSSVYQEFPYDATPLYLSRIAVLKNDPDMSPHYHELDEIEKVLLRNYGRDDQPSPYFAVLVADGDRMGATLGKMRDADEHREFSRNLSEFAQNARSIVEGHHGCLVYSGGDDVLAFIPVDQCLDAAKELHSDFEKKLTPVTDHLSTERPTLSVGIAIGYCFDPLEDLLASAREALRHAKEGEDRCSSTQRNGLAVHFVTRGSEAIRFRDNWNKNPDARLKQWISFLLEDLLPDRAVYDIYGLARDYAGWEGDSLKELILKELHRVLSKKRPGGKPLSPDVISAFEKAISKPGDLDRVARELLIAKHMVPIYKQARNLADKNKQNEDHWQDQRGGDKR